MNKPQLVSLGNIFFFRTVRRHLILFFDSFGFARLIGGWQDILQVNPALAGPDSEKRVQDRASSS